MLSKHDEKLTVVSRLLCPRDMAAANPLGHLFSSRSFSCTNAKYTSFSTAPGPQKASTTFTLLFTSKNELVSWVLA